jgi:hypothetical protein
MIDRIVLDEDIEKIAVSFSKVYSAVANRLSRHPSGKSMSKVFRNLSEEPLSHSVRFDQSRSKLVERIQKNFPKNGK